MLSADETNRRYFHEAYRTGCHGWGTDEPSPFVLEALERVREVGPGGRVLDLGCGEGRHSIAATRAGFRVVGVDYEPLAVQRARKAARAAGVAGITFRVADAFDLPFPDAYFTAVIDFGLLHSQRKAAWPRYLRSLRRVLRPRGFLVLSVFSPGFRLFHGSRRQWQIAQGGYRRYFTREDLEGLFGRDFEFLELTEDAGEDRGFWHALLQRK